MKFNMKKLVIILALIMLISFAVAGITLYFTGGINAVSVQSAQVKTSKNYPAESIENIIIKTVSTKVNVIPVVDKKISIDFYGNITTNLTRVQPKLNTSLDNGVLTIEISYPKTINIGLINFENLYLDVYVPDNYSKSIAVETVSGELNLRRFNLERLDFKSISGDISAETVSVGQLVIETVSGKTKLTDISGEIKIHTISGELNAVLESLTGNIVIKTISGKAVIELPQNSLFDFEFDTVSGNIKNEFAADIKFVDNRRIEGSVGKGSHRIIIETTSGDISVKQYY